MVQPLSVLLIRPFRFVVAALLVVIVSSSSHETTTASPLGKTQEAGHPPTFLSQPRHEQTWRNKVERWRGGDAPSGGAEKECRTYATIGVIDPNPQDDFNSASLRGEFLSLLLFFLTRNEPQRGLSDAAASLRSTFTNQTQSFFLCWSKSGNRLTSTQLPAHNNSDDSTRQLGANYETIGSLSDLIILLPFYSSLQPPLALIQKLVHGMQRRLRSNPAVVPTTLLLFTRNSHSPTFTSALSQHIQHTFSASLTPKLIVLTLPVTLNSSSQWQAAFHNALSSHTGVEKDLPISLFHTFAMSVYKALLHIQNDTLVLDENETLQEIHGNVDTTKFEHTGSSNHIIHDTASGSILLKQHHQHHPLSRSTKESLIASRVHQCTKLVIHEAQDQMSRLEAKQDQASLRRTMPILEFGTESQRILEAAAKQFDHHFFDDRDELERDDWEFVQVKRREMLHYLVGDSGIHRLFRQQLQALREHYGRGYESILEEIDPLDDNTTMDEEQPDNDKKQQHYQRRERDNAILVQAAEQSTNEFRAAAQNAIPTMCADLLHIEYEYMTVLQGLIRDMMDATSMRQGLINDWEEATFLNDNMDEQDDETDATKRKRENRSIKWYEKIAARALVFGVNYLQGWLALQGLRRAAAQRDKSMPKFPLF